ncbi:3-keto-5-aminohexanoate cleavage protein [Geodermatophilus sp. SYSU D00710]
MGRSVWIEVALNGAWTRQRQPQMPVTRVGECDPGATWMVAGLGVELAGLREEAVARGGHVRVGLEDAPLGCTRGNAGLVAAARRSVEPAGARPASAAEVRAATEAGRR